MHKINRKTLSIATTVLLIFLVGCSNQQTSKTPPTCECPEEQEPPEITSEMTIIGEVEYISVANEARDKARIDTGATTTSIDAQNITPFERDGEQWVSFEFSPRNKPALPLKRKVTRIAEIKRHGAKPTKRYVVEVELGIGEKIQSVEVSLADRSKFEYAILIGRNFLDSNYVVDVSKKYATADSEEE